MTSSSEPAGFRAAPDVRIFRLFAALNAAGYDLEGNPKGMHPTRSAVRRALGPWSSPTAEKLKNLVQATHQFVLVFWVLNREADDLTGLPKRSLAEAFGGGPEFAAMAQAIEPVIAEIVTGIMTELPWQGLWEEHFEAHEKEAERYRGPGAVAAAGVRAYMRAERPPTSSVVYVPNLLDSYYTGYGVDTGEENYVVGGPADEVSMAVVEHEYLHGFVNPAVNRETDLLAETSPLMATLFDQANPHLQPYRTWPAFLSENLVEAITHRLDHPGPETLARRIAHSTGVRGLSLVPRLMEPLAEAEGSGAPCEDWLPRVMRRVLLDKPAG